MKKTTIQIATLILLISFGIGCDQPKHRVATHKKRVQVHRTSSGQYVYQDPNSHLWYYLMMMNSQDSSTHTYSPSYYTGSLSSYRTSGANWQPVDAKDVPKEVQEQVEQENTQTEVDPSEQADAASVETVEVDVAANDQPVDPSSDLGSDGVSDSYSDSSSSDSGSFDSGGSDSSSSDSSSPD